MTILNIDIDDTLVDFTAHFLKVFDRHPDSVTRPEFLDMVTGESDFFRTMELMPGALEFLHAVQPLRPRLLTSCSASAFQQIAAAKRDWARATMPYRMDVVPVRQVSDKAAHIQTSDDVLVDDRQAAINAWTEAGGKAIRFRGDYAQVLSEIKRAVGGQYQQRPYPAYTSSHHFLADGVYAVRVPALDGLGQHVAGAPGEILLTDEILQFHQGVWTYPGTDTRFRNKVVFILGPLPRIHQKV